MDVQLTEQEQQDIRDRQEAVRAFAAASPVQQLKELAPMIHAATTIGEGGIGPILRNAAALQKALEVFAENLPWTPTGLREYQKEQWHAAFNLIFLLGEIIGKLDNETTRLMRELNALSNRAHEVD